MHTIGTFVLCSLPFQSTAMTSKPCSRRASDRPAEPQQSSMVTHLAEDAFPEDTSVLRDGRTPGCRRPGQ
eukprot:1035012-Heterocapsa_arctica.AAC.1